MNSLILSFFIAATAIFAAQFKLLEPGERTVWTTGTDVEVFWKWEGQAEEGKLKTLEFDLMQGRSRRPELVDNIAIGVSISNNDVLWTVDEKLATGDDYFVRVSSPEDPDFRYESTFFTIQQKGHSKRITGNNTSSASKMIKPCLAGAAAMAVFGFLL